MPRPRKKSTWLVVCADHLGCIDENRVLDLESEPKKNLLDELACPLADDVLIALRKSFSLTYPRNPFIDGLQQARSEIRRIAGESLQYLDSLQLLPCPSADRLIPVLG